MNTQNKLNTVIQLIDEIIDDMDCEQEPKYYYDLMQCEEILKNNSICYKALRKMSDDRINDLFKDFKDIF